MLLLRFLGKIGLAAGDLYLRLRSIPTQDPTMNRLFSVPAHRLTEEQQWMEATYAIDAKRQALLV
jgi:hypothetical protein